MPDRSAEFRYPRVAGEQAARALRLELELGFAPIAGPHLWRLISERGVDLAFHDFRKGGGDGLYLWNGERGLIVLNSSKTKKPTRLRFTAAHELGHHEMHRHSLSSVILPDLDILQDQTDIEKEANAFAAEFLAPEIGIRRELADKHPGEITPVEVVQLMRTYGLSYDAMLWRLVNCNLIAVADRERLAQEGRGKVSQLERVLGFDEAKLFGAPPEGLPEDFVLTALQLYQDGAIDGARLAELLRRGVRDATGLAEDVDVATSADVGELDRLLDL